MIACESSEQLLQRIRIQNGEEGDEDPEWDSGKIEWKQGADFGCPVEIQYGTESPPDHGYLTTLPGFHDCDTDGVIHLPHTYGEKCDAGPVFVTLMDATKVPGVTRIIVGANNS